MAYSQGVPHPPKFSEELLPHKNIGEKDFYNLLKAFKNTQNTNPTIKNQAMKIVKYIISKHELDLNIVPCYRYPAPHGCDKWAFCYGKNAGNRRNGDNIMYNMLKNYTDSDKEEMKRCGGP